MKEKAVFLREGVSNSFFNGRKGSRNKMKFPSSSLQYFKGAGLPGSPEHKLSPKTIQAEPHYEKVILREIMVILLTMK